MVVGSLRKGFPTVVFKAGSFSSVLLKPSDRPDGRTRFHFVVCCEVSGVTQDQLTLQDLRAFAGSAWDGSISLQFDSERPSEIVLDVPYSTQRYKNRLFLFGLTFGKFTP